MVKAIVGANWGDEGKGKITDMLAEHSDVVIRFQGGANAGHTIINDYGQLCAAHSAVRCFLPSHHQYHRKRRGTGRQEAGRRAEEHHRSAVCPLPT